METSALTALIAALIASAAVSTTIDPDIYLNAQEQSETIINQLDQRKTSEYDQICNLLSGCKKEGSNYAL